MDTGLRILKKDKMKGHYHDWERDVTLDQLICSCGRINQRELHASMQRVRLAFLGERSPLALSVIDGLDLSVLYCDSFSIKELM